MTADPTAENPSARAHRTHQSLIVDQFSHQAELFAQSPALHNEAALSLLVEAATPRPSDATLDVACGPGSIVVAFARMAKKSAGLDATPAMLREAEKLAAANHIANVEWHLGDVYALPLADNSFDIVTCRFAFHHLREPARALAEMVRVCRVGGRIALCDGIAADDPEKAAAFNRMEKHRDPSTVEFRTLGWRLALLKASGLPAPAKHFYQVPAERERLIAASFPANDDRALLRRMIDESVEGDRMGLAARRDRDTVKFAYPAAILVAEKPAS
jgi:ubiquinone/menaquinone biosynthesis C-methylase UbiE